MKHLLLEDDVHSENLPQLKSVSKHVLTSMTLKIHVSLSLRSLEDLFIETSRSITPVNKIVTYTRPQVNCAPLGDTVFKKSVESILIK